MERMPFTGKPKLDVKLGYIASRPARFVAFGFGSGLSPVAPGTVGTLVAYPLYWLMAGLPSPIYLAVLALLFAYGAWACEVTGRELGIADYNGIVWDEVVAMLLALHYTPPTLAWFVAAFFLFRLFDIWKPFPILYFDSRLKNGFGVMFDDLLAGVYTVAALKTLHWALA